MKTTVIKGSIREAVNSKTARAARLEHEIPCNLYGGAEHVHFTAGSKELRHILYTPDFHLVHLEVGGKTYKCIVKEIQQHPVTEAIEHLDFLELVDGKKVTVEIPVKLHGNPIGVKNGGKLIQKMRRIKIKTMPEHLKGELDINIESMDVGTIVRISDVSLEGAEIMHAPGIPILSITIPRTAKVAEPAAAAKPAAAKAPAAAAAAKPVKK